MKLRSKIAAAIAALLMATGVANADGHEVKIGVAAEPYPPFSSVDSSGKWVGWEIEFIDAMCAAAEMKCVIKPVAWDGIIPSLMGKQIDMIMSSMSITEKRKKAIDFSNKYYNTPAVIVANKGSGILPTNESLSGKTIGVQAATIHQAYADKHFPDATKKIYQTQDEANQDLVAGRVDALQADSIAMGAFIGSDSGTACCEIVGSVKDDPAILGLGVGVGIRKGEDELKAKVNAAIAKVREEGTYEEISKKYFDFDVYGE